MQKGAEEISLKIYSQEHIKIKIYISRLPEFEKVRQRNNSALCIVCAISHQLPSIYTIPAIQKTVLACCLQYLHQTLNVSFIYL